MEKIIKCKNISKTYGKGDELVAALSGVDIEIGGGEFVSVMGPSGSGKTSLLFALSGTDTVTGGAVEWRGTALSELSDNKLADLRRDGMGFVFQQPTLLKNLNILDNIILPSAFGNVRNIAATAERAKALMHKTGIAGLENRDITEVSGGQLQRACICRALMNEPEILFADEPTGALNSKAADEIMDLLSDANANGTAVFLVTHDAKVAARAERILFTKDGTVVAELRLGKYTPGGCELESRAERTVELMVKSGI